MRGNKTKKRERKETSLNKRLNQVDLAKKKKNKTKKQKQETKQKHFSSNKMFLHNSVKLLQSESEATQHVIGKKECEQQLNPIRAVIVMSHGRIVTTSRY